MKALTVQQPWAWAIIHGGKLVENRTTAWTYRGRLAIHAGRRWSLRGMAAVERITGRGIIPWEIAGDPMVIQGAIIGTVDLVDAHPDAGCCRPWGESEYLNADGTVRRSVVHLVLEDPQPCEPIPTPGRLGLWTWEPDQ